MVRVTLRGLLAHKLRFALTGLAVVLGTAFVAGALSLRASMEQGFEELFAAMLGDADVVVQPTGGETLAPRLVDELRALDEVADAAGEIRGDAVLVRDDGQPLVQFGATVALSAPREDTGLGYELAEGRWPRAAGEVAVDAPTVDAQGWAVGDELRVVLDGAAEPQRLVGAFSVGDLDSLVTSFVVLDEGTAGDRLGTGGAYTRVHVAAAAGVDGEAARDAVAAALGDGYRVRTAAEVAAAQQAQFAGFVDTFSTVLLGFAAVALLVGAFLIVNTFTIVLAQRVRELALLRAVGASPGQLLRSVLGEAAAVGVLGGAVGVVAGLALAAGLERLVAAVAVELPGAGPSLDAATAAVALAVGVVVTLGAASVPALRAVRVPPVVALREAALVAGGRRRWPRLAVGGLLLAGGVAAVLGGLAGEPGDAAVAAVGAGSVAAFLGVAALASLVARPLAGLLGEPLRLLGVSGELARKNAMRNPRRTAATASALMIGLALVGFVAVQASSLERAAERAIEGVFEVDALVAAQAGSGVPGAAVDDLEAAGELAAVAPLHMETVRIEGRSTTVMVIEPQDLRAVLRFDVLDGSLDDLGEGSLVATDRALGGGAGAGDRLTVEVDGEARELTVAAVVDGTDLGESWYLDPSPFGPGGPEGDPVNVYVTFAGGVDAGTAREALDAVLARYPQLVAFDQTALVDAIAEDIDALLGVVLALLGLSVLVALLGIVNTMALSVAERHREIGLLRAVGMQPRGVRRMVRGEALVVSVLGAALGLLLGVTFGAAFAEALELAQVAVPWGQLLAGLVAATVAGLLAGLLPARRAARLDVLEAVAAE